MPVTFDYAFWRDNAHKSGEQIAREYGLDAGNVRRELRKARVLYPELDWRGDPRHKERQECPPEAVCAPVSPRTGKVIPTSTEVVAGDFHVPYHDADSVGCLLGYLRDTQPQGFTINGDFIDCYALSSFSKDPRRELEMQAELDAANAVLDAIDAVIPRCEVKRFVVGNHEARLERYLRDHARAFHGLRALTLDALLRLTERGYEVVPMVGRDASVMIGKVEVGHFNVARKDAGASARALLLDRGCSVMQSHTHKLASIYKRARGTGEQQAAWEIGCMCDLSPEYITSPNWQAGFATITRCQSSDRYHVALHEIIGGELLVDGKRY